MSMQCRGNCNKEPILSELLEDPLVLLLMARDGVAPNDVKALMGNVIVQPECHENQAKAASCRCRY